MVGRKLSDEAKLKISKANKDRKRSDDSRYRMSVSAKGKIITSETQSKISNANKGKVFFSNETKRKISLAIQGENHPMFGKNHSLESKAKMSLIRNTLNIKKGYVRL